MSCIIVILQYINKHNVRYCRHSQTFCWQHCQASRLLKHVKIFTGQNSKYIEQIFQLLALLVSLILSEAGGLNMVFQGSLKNPFCLSFR